MYRQRWSSSSSQVFTIQYLYTILHPFVGLVHLKIASTHNFLFTNISRPLLCVCPLLQSPLSWLFMLSYKNTMQVYAYLYSLQKGHVQKYRLIFPFCAYIFLQTLQQFLDSFGRMLRRLLSYVKSCLAVKWAVEWCISDWIVFGNLFVWFDLLFLYWRIYFCNCKEIQFKVIPLKVVLSKTKKTIQNTLYIKLLGYLISILMMWLRILSMVNNF